MAVWLIALTWQAHNNSVSIPRRLIWVVNRRVVVDQATHEADALALRIKNLPEDDEFRKALSNMSASRKLLAVSTLRGERADNGDWKEDPSCAAIIIGTVDMIGSRLLFSGYGDSAYFRPQHAGLLAIDSVLVNDEAHLTVPFAKLLRDLEARKPADKLAGKQFRFVEMSATHAPANSGEIKRFPESLDEDCAASEIFAERFQTRKNLFLELQPDSKRTESKIVELATQSTAARTIIYIEQPDKAREICVRLRKQFPLTDQVQVLTGTMRGYERDRLDLENFKNVVPQHRVFLVATSAGEVGVDITAELVISGLVEINKLIQRFGRLDRYGKGGGEAHVIYTAAALKDKPIEKTLEFLQSLTPEFSSEILRASQIPADAQEVPAKTAMLHEWLIDLWCQTSGQVKDYPKVEDYLHGQQDDIPETELAWRADVEYLADPDLVSDEDRERVLEVFPVLSRERLREPTSKMKAKLEELAAREPGTRVLLRGRDGSVEPTSLKQITQKSSDISYCLVILPTTCAGIEFGMLSIAEGAPKATDKADGPMPNDRIRFRYLREGDQDKPLVASNVTPPENPKEVIQIDLTKEGDDSIRALVYVQEKPEPEKTNNFLLLTKHLDDVQQKARMLAEKLVPDLADVYAQAGAKHDIGKRSQLWQRCMGRHPSETVAKSYYVPYPKGLNGYRHELGSLVGEEVTGDLLLHLIAAHHGNARPHFTPTAIDGRSIRGSEKVIRETPARFARLTEQYGPWGLAYLEALLKAADAWASRGEPEDNA